MAADDHPNRRNTPERRECPWDRPPEVTGHHAGNNERDPHDNTDDKEPELVSIVHRARRTRLVRRHARLLPVSAASASGHFASRCGRDPLLRSHASAPRSQWLPSSAADLAQDDWRGVGPDEIIHVLTGMTGSQAEEHSEDGSRGSVVLVTGMSGSGKSTVVVELERRGHRVVDSDDPGWIVEASNAGGPEPVWDLDRIKALIEGHRAGCLFIAGCVANQGAVYDRFDAVVLLSAPVEVILDRVADRTNPFGSRAEDRAKIAADLAAFEPFLRASADHEIVTPAPVPDVVAALEQIANGARRRDPLGSRRGYRT